MDLLSKIDELITLVESIEEVWPSQRYSIETRLQDENWMVQCYTATKGYARIRARDYKRHPMSYGMVRIIDRYNREEIN
jgi:hypothetical protein